MTEKSAASNYHRTAGSANADRFPILIPTNQSPKITPDIRLLLVTQHPGRMETLDYGTTSLVHRRACNRERSTRLGRWEDNGPCPIFTVLISWRPTYQLVIKQSDSDYKKFANNVGKILKGMLQHMPNI
jgi:hypothetical protein